MCACGKRGAKAFLLIPFLFSLVASSKPLQWKYVCLFNFVGHGNDRTEFFGRGQKRYVGGRFLRGLSSFISSCLNFHSIYRSQVRTKKPKTWEFWPKNGDAGVFFLYLVCVEIAHEWKMLLLRKMVCLRTIGFVDRQRRTLFRLFSPGASHFYWCRAGYFQETLPPDMIGSGISADVIGSNKIVLIFYWPSIYYSDNIAWFEMRNVFFFLATQYCSCIKTIEGAWQNR